MKKFWKYCKNSWTKFWYNPRKNETLEIFLIVFLVIIPLCIVALLTVIRRLLE
jgi:diacylglycerol kinase